jgi:hypothetical protein
MVKTGTRGGFQYPRVLFFLYLFLFVGLVSYEKPNGDCDNAVCESGVFHKEIVWGLLAILTVLVSVYWRFVICEKVC